MSLDASRFFSFITFLFHFDDNVFVVHFCLQLMELFYWGLMVIIKFRKNLAIFCTNIFCSLHTLLSVTVTKYMLV